jgi:putative transposase
MDNGPELIVKLAQAWSTMNEIEFKSIQPGKPTQNAYIERFNKSYREGILDRYLFDTFDEVREVARVWVDGYNNQRPHDTIGGLSPRTYRAQNSNRNELIHGLRSASAMPSLNYTHESTMNTNE